uniref:Glucuronosyltransferase n=1 Tax=Angiostrongylus cantonensis TaxID=6313 RepID=A0A0K0D4V4_ANGCA
MRHWTFICSCLLACDTYKFLINTPMFAYSHTNFMGAIADTLTEAGHNVVSSDSHRRFHQWLYISVIIEKLRWLTRSQLYNVEWKAPFIKKCPTSATKYQLSLSRRLSRHQRSNETLCSFIAKKYCK